MAEREAFIKKYKTDPAPPSPNGRTPMTETPPELLPCPFCGGEAERTTIEEEGDNFGGDVITCKRCFASSHVEFGFKENIVSHWNTRTDLISTRTYEDGVMAAAELVPPGNTRNEILALLKVNTPALEIKTVPEGIPK